MAQHTASTPHFKVGDLVKSRWVLNVEPGHVGRVAADGSWFAFADALDEVCRSSDYVLVESADDSKLIEADEQAGALESVKAGLDDLMAQTDELTDELWESNCNSDAHHEAFTLLAQARDLMESARKRLA